MSRVAIAVCLFLSCLFAALPAQAGVSKKIAKQAVEDFNQQHRAVRAEHMLLPVNYVEVRGQSYAYFVPRRMKRLVDDGTDFRIRKFKTKKRHVILEMETVAGARLDVLVYDNQKLTQVFLDEVVPLAMSTLFEFGEAPSLPPFVGNQESSLLHIVSCNHLPVADQRLEFESLDTAAAAGYRPCPVCFTDENILPLDDFSAVRMTAIERARLYQLAFPAVADSAVQDRVRQVGEKVLSNFPVDLVGYDYEFIVIRSPLPQALAMPTGFVFVSDSLLDMIEHELELEFVIAHEVAHCELSLPPVGDNYPYYSGEYGPTYEYISTWQRHLETVADVLAIHYLHDVADETDIVARARNILAKLQFAHEAVPSLEEDKYASHPTYTARLKLFQSSNYRPAAPQEPMEYRPKGDESLFEIRVLGKSRDEQHTYVYLLVEGTDLVNKEWKVHPNNELGILYDARGESYELFSSQIHHKTEAGDIEVIKAEVGRSRVFDSIDLDTGPLRMAGNAGDGVGLH